MLRGTWSMRAFLALLFLGASATLCVADIQEACQSDYQRYCSNTEPWSGPCRACMRKVGRAHRLSQGCIQALVAAGEVTAADRYHYSSRPKK